MNVAKIMQQWELPITPDERARDRSDELSVLLTGSPQLRARVSITCFGKTDGGGAQCHAVLSALFFSHQHGVAYLHQPFVLVDHRECEHLRWTRRWERFLDLGKGFERLVHGANFVAVSDFVDAPDAHPGPVVLHAQAFHFFANQQPDAYEEIVAPLRHRFERRMRWASLRRWLAVVGRSKQFRVAVHIRRGDVSSDNSWSDRYTSNEVILRKLDAVAAELSKKAIPFVVDIYSEGVLEDFTVLSERGYHVHLGRSVFKDFEAMVTADLLITAKSSLSCLAGLLSRGIVIYEDAYHKPQSHWIVADGSGRFDVGLLQARLAAINCPLT
ncbi:hypothetical protein [Rariglobus hedericola]|uniref:Uncharacterized protein n=1 Tax=Rariglobus hedericola TaxID=2597822 RepID=A0A556QJ40_9BACT|nr:hypothetical protein [Rariglobus hedericola]TSJ76660.1 hypothetical protein FPL22_11065 [Rariglobus hedericola]